MDRIRRINFNSRSPIPELRPNTSSPGKSSFTPSKKFRVKPKKLSFKRKLNESFNQKLKKNLQRFNYFKSTNPFTSSSNCPSRRSSNSPMKLTQRSQLQETQTYKELTKKIQGISSESPKADPCFFKSHRERTTKKLYKNIFVKDEKRKKEINDSLMKDFHKEKDDVIMKIGMTVPRSLMSVRQQIQLGLSSYHR